MAAYESLKAGGGRLSEPIPAHDRKFVVALARGLDVLRAFTPNEGLLGNQEIVTRTGLPKATVSRLTYIYVEHCRSKAAVMLRLDMGSRIPIATTAMGRALIAALPERERDWLLSHIARREGERWPKIRSGIDRAIKDLAARGFTVSAGDWQPDVFAVGVPLIA